MSLGEDTTQPEKPIGSRLKSSRKLQARPRPEQRLVEARRPDAPGADSDLAGSGRPRWRRRRWLIALIAIAGHRRDRRWRSDGGSRRANGSAPTMRSSIRTPSRSVRRSPAASRPCWSTTTRKCAPVSRSSNSIRPTSRQPSPRRWPTKQSAQGQLAQAKAQLPVAQANLDQARAQVASPRRPPQRRHQPEARPDAGANGRAGGLPPTARQRHRDGAQRRRQSRRGAAKGRWRARPRLGLNKNADCRRPKPACARRRRRSSRRASTCPTP